MLSLLLSKESQPGKPFVLLQNLKATFQPMGVKRSPLAANKKQETLCCSGCERPLKLFQPFAFVVLLSSPCLPLFLFPSPERAAQEARLTSLAVAAHVSRTTHRENEFIRTQWQVAHCSAVHLATAIFLTAVQ